jgi:hypothetical protein
MSATASSFSRYEKGNSPSLPATRSVKEWSGFLKHRKESRIDWGDELRHHQGSLPLPMIGLDTNVVQPNRIELRSMDRRGRLSLHESLSIPHS